MIQWTVGKVVSDVAHRPLVCMYNYKRRRCKHICMNKIMYKHVLILFKKVKVLKGYNSRIPSYIIWYSNTRYNKNVLNSCREKCYKACNSVCLNVYQSFRNIQIQLVYRLLLSYRRKNDCILQHRNRYLKEILRI